MIIYFFQRDRRSIINLGKYIILEADYGKEALTKAFLIQEVANPYAQPGYLICISGPDSFAGGAYCLTAACFLFQSVKEDMIGHNQMSTVADD